MSLRLYDCAAFKMKRGQKAILNFPLEAEANPKLNNSGRKGEYIKAILPHVNQCLRN
jgi:hypothetical protein